MTFAEKVKEDIASIEGSTFKERVENIGGEYGWKDPDRAWETAQEMSRFLGEDEVLYFMSDIYWHAANGFGA